MINLLEADSVTVTTVMDNSVDLLMADHDIATRFHLASRTLLPIAEHGFSALIQVRCGNREETVLFDTGVSANGVLHNLKAMNISLSSIQAIVLSHGHNDHSNGLPEIIRELKDRKIVLVQHPDVCLERKIVQPNGDEWNISPPPLSDLCGKNVTVINSATPTLPSNGSILASGEIARVTSFETGFPIHYTKREGDWVQDPIIRDDQCLIMKIKGRGLVIITGCCHAGIINTILYARKISGIKEVLAVMGGFHLTGGIFEKIIPETIAEMQQINPRYLVPGHCTGFSAIHQLAGAMPAAFIPNSVGTKFIFNA